MLTATGALALAEPGAIGFDGAALAPAEPSPLPPRPSPELLARYDRPGPRYTSYPPVTAWSPMDASAYAARLDTVYAQPESLSLYVHFPFCAARCLYCGCNAAVTRRAEVIDTFLDRLAREADLVVHHLGDGQRVEQLHWGGGTPNLLDARQLARAHRIVADRFDVGAHGERSIEADPRLVTRAQLDALVALDFDRISFGVQDTDPEVQAAIGREQPLDLVARAVADSRAAGFGGINVDVIYGLPAQTRASFARTLADVVALAPDRVACFGYAHVPWARPHQRRMDAERLPDAVLRAELFAMAVETLVGAGYVWIGLDHFARPDDPLARAARTGRLWRDFMGYTVRPTRHLVGLGPSAIGEVAGAFAQNAAHLGEWQRLVDAGTLPVTRGHALTHDDHVRRRVIVALMCALEAPEALLPPLAAGARAALAELEADGLVERAAGRLRVTPAGRFFLRNVCMAFDATLPGASGGEAAPAAGSTPRFSRTV